MPAWASWSSTRVARVRLERRARGDRVAPGVQHLGECIPAGPSPCRPSRCGTPVKPSSLSWRRRRRAHANRAVRAARRRPRRGRPSRSRRRESRRGNDVAQRLGCGESFETGSSWVESHGRPPPRRSGCRTGSRGGRSGRRRGRRSARPRSRRGSTGKRSAPAGSVSTPPASSSTGAAPAMSHSEARWSCDEGERSRRDIA